MYPGRWSSAERQSVWQVLQIGMTVSSTGCFWLMLSWAAQAARTAMPAAARKASIVIRIDDLMIPPPLCRRPRRRGLCFRREREVEMVDELQQAAHVLLVVSI